MRLLRAGRRPARQPLLRPRLDRRGRPPQPAGGDRPQGHRPRRHRDDTRRLTHAPPRHHLRVARRSGRAGRSRPDAGRDGGAVLHRQRSRGPRGRLEGGGRCGARHAARRAARPAPSDVGRSVDRQGGEPCPHHPGAHSRRLRLVALWLRPAERGGARTRHQAGAAARRMPRPRRAADRTFDPARAASSRRCSAISARAGRPTCARWCAGWPAMPGARSSPAEPRPQPLPKVGFYDPGRPRPCARSDDARRAVATGHSPPSSRSCSIARCCLPPTSRRSTRWPQALDAAGHGRRCRSSSRA